jgi:YaiO family outer membrane protein
MPILIFFLVAILFASAAPAVAQTPAPATAKPPAPAPHPWKVSITGQHGELSGDHDEEGQYTFSLARTVNHRLTVTGSVDQHNRFDELDTQAVGGVQIVFPKRRSLLNITYTEGFGAQQASQHGIDTSFSWQAHNHVRPELEIEYDRYIDENFLTKFTAGVALIPNAKFQSQLQWILSSASQDKGGSAGVFGFSYAADHRTTITAGAGYGHQHFIAKAVEEIKEDLTVLVVDAGVSWTLAKRNTLGVQWQFQDRRHAYNTNLFIVNWSRTF